MRTKKLPEKALSTIQVDREIWIKLKSVASSRKIPLLRLTNMYLETMLDREKLATLSCSPREMRSMYSPASRGWRI